MSLSLSPLAYAREAERQRHIANRVATLGEPGAIELAARYLRNARRLESVARSEAR